MKFKFSVLALLILALNCNAAEQYSIIPPYQYQPSIPFEQLLENPEFAKLENDIKDLKSSVKSLKLGLEDIKQSVIFTGERVKNANGNMEWEKIHPRPRI